MLPPLLGIVLLPLYGKYLTTSEYGVVAAMGVLWGLNTNFIILPLRSPAD